MSSNPPLAIDTSPSLFARLVVFNNDGSAIFRLTAKSQFDYDSSAPKFEGRRPKLLNESNELVGECEFTDSSAEDGTIDLHFRIDDASARAKLASGTLLGINLPIKTVGREPKPSGQYTCVLTGACRLTDSASRTVILPTEKMFKVVRDNGKVEKCEFVTGNGIPVESIQLVKGIHLRGSEPLGFDSLAKSAESGGVHLDATARAIQKINQGDPERFAGGLPPKSANSENDNVRTPPKRPNAQWNGQGLPPGHADLKREPGSDPTIEWIKLAHTQPKPLRG